MTLADYNSCVDQHADGLYRFALKNMRDEETAKDIVQESFARLWMKVETVDGKKAKSYLFTTAHHVMVDTVRKDKRSTRMEVVHEQMVYGTQSQPDLQEILDEGLSRLPNIQQQVVLLRDLEGYSYDEIAEMTELTLAQVKVYIYRARTALKTYIGSLDMVI